MGDDNDAIGLKVRDVMAGSMAERDRLAQHLEMAAGVVQEVTADGLVVVQDEIVRGLALWAVEGLFQPTVKGCRRKRSGRVSPGTNGGDDHQANESKQRAKEKNSEPQRRKELRTRCEPSQTGLVRTPFPDDTDQLAIRRRSSENQTWIFPGGDRRAANGFAGRCPDTERGGGSVAHLCKVKI